MTESRKLSDYAFGRLQKLARANKLPPETLSLLEAMDGRGTLTGEMRLIPKVEVERQRSGGGRNNRTRHFNSAADMQNYVTMQQTRFTRDSSSWRDEVIAEIDKLPGKGWGAEPMRIILDDRSEWLSVTEICPGCHGRGGESCQQCRGSSVQRCHVCGGQRQERCAYCNGSGRLSDDSSCQSCSATGWLQCRQCSGRGEYACSACGGRGNLSCRQCKGAGKTTIEVKLTYGADALFKAGSGVEVLPAIRRCLDRIGVASLAQGHAAISFDPVPGESEDTLALSYTASFPFAGMQMLFGKKKATIVAFGNKAMLLEVPPFLDSAAKTALASLEGTHDLSHALQRVRGVQICDTALKLLLTHKTAADDLLRQCPVGLSKDMAETVMLTFSAALRRMTERARLLGALLGLVAGLVVAVVPLVLPQITQLPLALRLVAEIVFPLIGGWLLVAIIGQAGRYALKQTFVDDQLALHQRSGKIGYAAGVLYTLLFVLLSLFGHFKPAWVHLLLKAYGL